MMHCSDTHKSTLSIRPRNNIYNRTRGSPSGLIPETVLLLAYQPKAQGIHQHRLCPLQHLLREGNAMESSDSMLPRNRTMGPPSSPLVFLVTDQLQALSVLIFKREHGPAEALPSSFLRNTKRFQSILPIRYRFSWNGEGSLCSLPGTPETPRLTGPWEER